MKRFCTALLALFLVLAPLAAAPTEARADVGDGTITDYSVSATVDASGTAAVQLNLTYAFGRDGGHGVKLFFPLRQEIADDPDHWRMLDMTIGDVNSPSGANAEVQTEEEDGNLLVRVGSENQIFTGVQTYQVNYTIRGLIAPKQAQSGLDEFNWNAIGNAWEVAIDKASVTVVGPAAVSRAACFSGYDFTTPCTATPAGSAASFAATGVGLLIVTMLVFLFGGLVRPVTPPTPHLRSSDREAGRSGPGNRHHPAIRPSSDPARTTGSSRCRVPLPARAR